MLVRDPRRRLYSAFRSLHADGMPAHETMLLRATARTMEQYAATPGILDLGLILTGNSSLGLIFARISSVVVLSILDLGLIVAVFLDEPCDPICRVRAGSRALLGVLLLLPLLIGLLCATSSPSFGTSGIAG